MPDLADPEYRPTTYTYFDKNLEAVWISQVPTSDEEALNYFMIGYLAKYYQIEVVYIQARRPDGARDTIKSPPELNDGMHV